MLAPFMLTPLYDHPPLQLPPFTVAPLQSPLYGRPFTVAPLRLPLYGRPFTVAPLWSPLYTRPFMVVLLLSPLYSCPFTVALAVTLAFMLTVDLTVTLLPVAFTGTMIVEVKIKVCCITIILFIKI